MAFACSAVMSNFALLNVWLAIFGVLLVAFVVRNGSLSEARIPIPHHGLRLRLRDPGVPDSAAVRCRALRGRGVLPGLRLSSSLNEANTGEDYRAR
jgi:hypothetical protein